MNNFYRVQNKEESENWGNDFCGYETLVGPRDFLCTLTEPEDRTWGRDLEKVVDRLNELETENAQLKQKIKDLEEQVNIALDDIIP